jgi:NADH-quinone oxidoreductase subunit N
MVFNIFEIGLGVTLILYMISFFIERNFLYSVYLLVQSIIVLLVINLYVPRLSVEGFSVLSNYNTIWFFKIIILIFYLVFIVFFFLNLRLTVFQTRLINLDNLNGIFEYLFLTFVIICSGFLFVSSNELLLIYIFLEVQSLTLYILAAFNYDSTRSSEASLKYFIFGSLFSGLFLMGWVLLFFSSGLSNLYDMQDFFSFFCWPDFYIDYMSMVNYQLVTSQLGLFFIVLAFIGKVGLFPFHQWMVDVYDSVSNITLFFFAIFPKLFLIFFFVRFYISLNVLFGYGSFKFIFALIGLGSILFGCVSNLSQWKLKRFLAFSSIVNLGYIFLFFSIGFLNAVAVFGILFNLFLYVILIFSFFSTFLILRKSREHSSITDLNELFPLKGTNRFWSFSLFINMLSMAGVPPLLGFYGKFYLMSFLWINCLWFSLFVVLCGSLLSAFYYIRIARSLFNFTGPFVFLKQGDYLFNFLNFLFVLFQTCFIFFFFLYVPLIFEYFL